MRTETEHSLYDGMKHEQDREGPPPGFPELPLIPGGRYTDPAFLELEQRYLWRRSWLYALHVDELPRPGSFRIWRKTGAPIIIVRGKDNASAPSTTPAGTVVRRWSKKSRARPRGSSAATTAGPTTSLAG